MSREIAHSQGADALQIEDRLMAERPYQDPNHPGNAIRPEVRCLGCGKCGCVTAWGPWCFDCNAARMDRISDALSPVSEALGLGKL